MFCLGVMSVYKKLPLGWYALALSVFLIDQISKLLVNKYFNLYEPLAIIPGLNLTLAYNTGAAFSFLDQANGWQQWLFGSIAAGVSLYFALWLWRLPAGQYRLAAGLSLILGGALGNLIDRMVYGYVIDFIQVYVSHYHWPIFNIADSAISVGALILIIEFFFRHPESQ